MEFEAEKWSLRPINAVHTSAQAVQKSLPRCIMSIYCMAPRPSKGPEAHKKCRGTFYGPRGPYEASGPCKTSFMHRGRLFFAQFWL